MTILKNFEDDRGYLWEAPTEMDDRIRVRDFDGNVATWYDPGDEGYDEAIARFQSREEHSTLDYGAEFVLYLRNGNTIHTDTFDNNEAGSSYVRVCDPDGNEVAYWVHDEWREEPELVMGAILGAAGAGRDANEPGPSHHLHPARDSEFTILGDERT